MSAHLPPPSADALAHSTALVDHIRDAIRASGGWMPFATYMEHALYAPGLGYYAAGTAKFGDAGDFVTAPELSPLFGQTLAGIVADVLSRTGGDVLELGAGSGRLALDVLLELERLGQLPGRYLILEPSPDLRARQSALLQSQATGLYSRVVWLDALPQGFKGMVLANEVLDALPVHLVHWTPAGPRERGVTLDGDRFAWADAPIASPALATAAGALPVNVPYLSEINLAASALVASLAATLEQGALMFVDYGFNRAEYYHPQRHQGTLKVHYRHHSLDDPFFLPGLADITAHVDFTAVSEAGAASGLDLLGYATQGRFLLDAGLLDRMSSMTPGTPDYLRAVQAVQKLVQPHEMGELFKVMLLGRGVAPPAASRRMDRL